MSPELPQPQHWWLEKDNHYQASLRGISAKNINDGEKPGKQLRDVFNSVISAISNSASELDQSDYLQRLRKSVESDLPVSRQRAVYSRTNSMKAVVASLVDELENEAGVGRHKAAS